MKKLHLHFFSEKTGKSKSKIVSLRRPFLWFLCAIIAAFGFFIFSPLELVNKLSDGTLLDLRKQNREIRKNVRKLEADNDSAELYLNRTKDFQDSIYKVGGLPEAPRKKDSAYKKERTEALFQTYRTYGIFRDSLLAAPELSAAIPVIHPLRKHHTVTTRFGMTFDHFTDQELPHRGVDFFADEGDTVMATGSGTIAEVRAHRGFGLSVKIQHTDRIKTFYAHLEKAFVKPGQKIQRGTPIATVGRSGRTAGSGLHYEIRIDGEPVNPEDYFISH